jgi:hypothetical protein
VEADFGVVTTIRRGPIELIRNQTTAHTAWNFVPGESFSEKQLSGASKTRICLPSRRLRPDRRPFRGVH